jgi:5'-3' exonuclease
VPAPLLIADVPWLLYRSYFGLPGSITDGHGHPVNALLGTVNALLAAIEACAPRAIVACFGAEGAAYRIALYPAYHAQRPPMPDELRRQWDRAPALLESFGWTVAGSEELEADDLMFSYARAEAAAGARALLLTGDRDLYQAVDEHVGILELGRGSAPPGEVDAGEVRRRYGVVPAMVPDFIALRGDPSDNLPGAPGIGEKTARDLLLRHGTLERTLQATIGERPRVAAALRENAELLRTFRAIATLVLVEVARPDDAPTDHLAGAQAVEELGMARLAARLRRLGGGREGRPSADPTA